MMSIAGAAKRSKMGATSVKSPAALREREREREGEKRLEERS